MLTSGLGFRLVEGQLSAHDPLLSLAKAHCVQLLGWEATHLEHRGSQETLQGVTASTHGDEHPAASVEKSAASDDRLNCRASSTQVTVKRAVALEELFKADRTALFTDPEGPTERQLMTTSEYTEENEPLIWSSV